MTVDNVLRSGAFFVVDAGGALQDRLSAGVESGEEGYAVATLPRPGSPSDALIRGGRNLGRVEVYDPATNRSVQVTFAGAEGSIGRAVALSEPLANGTRRLFVSEPGHRNSRGRILIYSIR